MMLLGEQAISGADLRVGAAPVEAECRVMVWSTGLQPRKLNGGRAEVPASWLSSLGFRGDAGQSWCVQQVAIHSDGACHGNPGPGGTPSAQIARRLALLWGTHAVQTKDIGSFEEMIAKGKRMALRQGFGTAGSKLVALAGVPFGTPGSTNLLHVVTLSGDELKGR